MERMVAISEIYRRFFNGGNGIARLHVSDIDTLPTVDAAPVICGHWILRDNGIHENLNSGKPVRFYLCECSKCGYHTGNQGRSFNYCPKCGAFMEQH